MDWNSWSILDQHPNHHLISSWLIVGGVLNDSYLVYSQLTVGWDVDGMSIECQPRCQWSVGWILTLYHRYLYCTIQDVLEATLPPAWGVCPFFLQLRENSILMCATSHFKKKALPIEKLEKLSISRAEISIVCEYSAQSGKLRGWGLRFSGKSVFVCQQDRKMMWNIKILLKLCQTLLQYFHW